MSLLQTRRKKVVLVILAFLAVVGVGLCALVSSLNHLGDALKFRQYKGYVWDYMSEQKRKYGHWPADLSGLPQSVRQELQHEKGGYVRERLEYVLKFHQSHYKGMDILHKDASRITFRVQLSDQSFELQLDGSK